MSDAHQRPLCGHRVTRPRVSIYCVSCQQPRIRSCCNFTSHGCRAPELGFIPPAGQSPFGPPKSLETSPSTAAAEG
jgi:hypothetical protein